MGLRLFSVEMKWILTPTPPPSPVRTLPPGRTLTASMDAPSRLSSRLPATVYPRPLKAKACQIFERSPALNKLTNATGIYTPTRTAALMKIAV